jgi:DNA topoisomerase 2-associated protein PAT1
MSFFGFDTTLPRDRAPPGDKRGIFDTPDPFAEVARARAHAPDDDDDV